MNFDVNMLSTLMQLMNSQRPRESDEPAPRNTAADTENQTAQPGDGTAVQSVFAMQNGLGQRIDLNPNQEKKQKPSSGSMSPLLDMFTGKSSGENSDAMANLMPMLMNMMGSKNARVAQNGGNPNNSFEQKLKNAKNSAQSSAKSKNSISNAVNEKPKSKSRDRYDPITFAGYTLISSLNKLYSYKKSERLNLLK